MVWLVGGVCVCWGERGGGLSQSSPAFRPDPIACVYTKMRTYLLGHGRRQRVDIHDGGRRVLRHGCLTYICGHVVCNVCGGRMGCKHGCVGYWRWGE